MRLKKSYSSREVAVLTGLTARQLQWWDSRGLVQSAIASHRTDAGGFTERRYSPIELYELTVLADLRRRGFSVQSLREMLDMLRSRFGARLFDVIEGGPLTLLTDDDDVFVRTASGDLHSLVKSPGQRLLGVGQEGRLRPLSARMRSRRRPAKRAAPEAPSAGRAVGRPADAEPDEADSREIEPSGEPDEES